MAEQCDVRGCPADAIVFLVLRGMSLGFCGHDFDDRMLDLFGKGWAVAFDNRPALRLREKDRK